MPTITPTLPVATQGDELAQEFELDVRISLSSTVPTAPNAIVSIRCTTKATTCTDLCTATCTGPRCTFAC